MAHDVIGADKSARTRRYYVFGQSVVIPREAVELMKPHARRRGMHPIKLIQQLVMLAASNDLVDAIMDDNGGRDA